MMKRRLTGLWSSNAQSEFVAGFPPANAEELLQAAVDRWERDNSGTGPLF